MALHNRNLNNLQHNEFSNITQNRSARAKTLQEWRKNIRTALFSNNRLFSKNDVCLDETKDITKGFRDVISNRIRLAKYLQEHRKAQRLELFSNNRKSINKLHREKYNQQKLYPLQQESFIAPNVLTNKPTQVVKKGPEKHKKSTLNQRPPFVVGIVHHPLSPTPPFNIDSRRSPLKNSNHQVLQTKKISKVTEKRLAAKAALKLNAENICPKNCTMTVNQREIVQLSKQNKDEKRNENIMQCFPRNTKITR